MDVEVASAVRCAATGKEHDGNTADTPLETPLATPNTHSNARQQNLAIGAQCAGVSWKGKNLTHAAPAG